MKKLLHDFFSTPLKFHILLLLGLNMSLLYLYFLFILKRPIREIPFILTFWNLCGLLTIISLQIYFFYRYFKPSPSSSMLLITVVKKYLYWVIDSLVFLDKSIKSLPFLETHYNNIILSVIRNVNNNRKTLWKNTLIILNLLPRLILVTVCFFDVFYFHQLHYIYNCIWLGIIPYSYYYIIYCLRDFNQDTIAFLEKNVTYIRTIYRYGILPPEEDYWRDEYICEDDEPNEEPPHHMKLTVQNFLNYRWWCVKNNDKHKDDEFYCDITTEYFYDYIIRFHLLPEQTLSDLQQRELYNSVGEKVHDIMKNHQILEVIKGSLSSIYTNKTITATSLLVLWFYLLSWSYILIVSLPSLSIITFIDILIRTLNTLEEPFSGESIFPDFIDHLCENKDIFIIDIIPKDTIKDDSD